VAGPVLGALEIFSGLADRELDRLDFKQSCEGRDIELGVAVGGGDIVLLLDGGMERVFRNNPVDGSVDLVVRPAVVLAVSVLQVLPDPGSHFG